jgi:uncharacterized protein (TIGR00255 family)
MIRSMTGYGSASLESPSLRASVSVKSLNHRFLDVVVHLPRRLSTLEAGAKERVARTVGRGRVEVSLQASVEGAAGESVVPVKPLVASLVRALRDMQNEFGLEGGVAVSDLVRFPGALERVEVPASVPDEVESALLGLVEEAVAGLDAMRRGEGDRLQRELERALACIEERTTRIEARWTELRATRRESLLEKARGLASELGLDDARLYQEVVRAVERHDIAEEVQRLRSHSESARELIHADGTPSGKRLDFLAQELMREANTIGSKIADGPSVRELVDLKAEIERLREQVQNVE